MSLLSVKKASSKDIQPKVETKKFVCDLCDKIFDKKGPMANHRIHVHTVKTSELYCDFCDNVFNSKKDLCTHISYKHSEHFVKQELEITNTAKQETVNSKTTSETEEGDGFKIKTTLVRCNLCDTSFVNSLALQEHNQQSHENKQVTALNIKEIPQEKEDKDDKVELNYILNELKNVKVAKMNAKRPMECTNIEVDDLNLRFEMNSALYLVAKEELLKLSPGQQIRSDKINLQIESKSTQTDKVDNNPATVIKLTITECATKF